MQALSAIVAGVLAVFAVLAAVVARLVSTAHKPRPPTDAERYFTHPLTGERIKFPSLLEEKEKDDQEEEEEEDDEKEQRGKNSSTADSTNNSSRASSSVPSDHPSKNGLKQRKQPSSKSSVPSADLVDLSLVVPAFNESQRITVMLEEAVDFLESRSKANLAWTYEVIVVDDGSTDNTGQVVQQFARERKCPNLRLLTLVKNRGKGGAVSQGMISSRGRTILFADADGATRFSDLNELEAQLSKVSRNGRGVAVGSRAHMVKSEAVVKRSFIRNFLMHSFHTLLFVLGIASIRDTQCGFKMMTRDAASAIVPNMHVEGWIFDIEMLLLALWQDIPIVEVPVSWHEVDGTKMSLARDSIKMAIDLFTIRFNYFVGVWKIRK